MTLRRVRADTIKLLAGCALWATGCQSQLGRIFHHPGLEGARIGEPILAADFGAAQPTPGATTTAPTTSRPATRPTTRPAIRRIRQPYTPPVLGTRGISFLALLAASVGAAEGEDAAKEASESSIGMGGAVFGRAGLAAPQPIARQVVVGRPGLSRGFATGLGFASDKTVFTLQSNPLSGPSGVCQGLSRAGFFGGSATACEANFRR